jgi:hypothetical protein
MTWKRYVIWLAAAVGSLALAAMPAAAVIRGTQDTGIFSNTGLIRVNGHHWCSGALYRTDHTAASSVMFMTAAHCITLAPSPATYEVTFDPAGDTNPNATFIPVVAAYGFPSYMNPAKSNNSLQNGNAMPDVAVLKLAYAPEGVTPADLPSAGLVDQLNPKTAISVVGYGINDFLNANTFSIGARFYKTVSISTGQRTQTSPLYVKTTAGACSGDSGGPNFLGNTIIGDTSWGQSLVCGDNSYVNRIDNPDELNFLANPAEFAGN